jgi:methylthioribose-1-phosphate isomerase
VPPACAASYGIVIEAYTRTKNKDEAMRHLSHMVKMRYRPRPIAVRKLMQLAAGMDDATSVRVCLDVLGKFGEAVDDAETVRLVTDLGLRTGSEQLLTDLCDLIEAAGVSS